MANTEGKVYSTTKDETEVASCGKITGISPINQVINAIDNNLLSRRCSYDMNHDIDLQITAYRINTHIYYLVLGSD